MARLEILSIVIFTTVLAISIQQACALECWKCESKEQQFCGEKLDSSKVSAEDKSKYYHKCDGMKCSKAVVTDGGTTKATSRSCVPDEKTGQAFCKAAEAAMQAQGHPNAALKCWFCDSDGCNGSAKYGPIALLVALPVAIAKIYSL